MAYAVIKILFTRVPQGVEHLNISETSLGISFNEVFKDYRSAAGECEVPYFEAGDYPYTPDRYVGFISDFYKFALDSDYNTEGKFTIISINNGEGTGTGAVEIRANFTGANFEVVSKNVQASIRIEPETGTPPDPEPVPNSVDPKKLIFDVITDIPTSYGENINIVASDPWLITSDIPDWLEVSQLSGTGNSVVLITPTNYSLLDIGQYSTALNIQIGEDSFLVEIIMNVFNTIVNPYPSGITAFTLDEKYFTILGNRTNTYFQFNSTITIHKFTSGEIVTRTIPQKALLFKGKSKIYLGPLIHRLMDRFQNINENQYKLAKLNIECTEVDSTNGTIISTINIPEIKFAAGLSHGFSNFGFLEFNPKPTRVTKNGFYFLNILIPNGAFELKKFKNGQLETTLPLPILTEGPICYKVFFDTYSKGDYVEFVIDEIENASENPPRKGFYIFPDQFFSNVIIWENEFLLQSALEFTNDQDISMEIERQTSKNTIGLREKTIHHSVSKENKLTINTGWISKNDIDSIESLVLSKRAFLAVNGKMIDLVPINKTFKGYNSDQELYDYTFEFTINRIYNEETYTF